MLVYFSESQKFGARTALIAYSTIVAQSDAAPATRATLRMATVDDIPSWSRLAPHIAISYAKLQDESQARELAEAARVAEEAAAEWLVAWPGGDLDAKDEEGWSALQRAAEAKQAAAMAELLRRPGVEVNGVEPARGQTALFLA